MSRDKKVALKKVLTSHQLVSYKNARFSKYRKRLLYFLYVNKLFLQFEKGEEIEISCDVTYRVEVNEFGDKILIVKLYKTSSYAIDEKLKKMSNALTTLFNSDLLEVSDEMSYIQYSFILEPSKELEREIFTNDIERFERDYIYLSQRFTMDLSRYPSLLLTGATRSGKSLMICHLLLEMLRLNISENDNEYIFVCDGKGLELANYCDVLGLDVSTNSEEILETVKRVHTIMKYRQDHRLRQEQRVWLVIDEFSSVQDSFADDKEGKEKRKLFMKLVGDIVRLGGSCRVSLVIGNQVSNTDRIPSEIKNNILTRINMGKIVSGDQWRVLFGQEEQIDYSVPGPGHGILFNETGLHKFVAPFVVMEQY